MKKSFFILSILFSIPFVTFATSGACSSHGGVNCSAQISSYDKVICNDGWTNSSVYYYESNECSASSCTAPSGSGCKTESDYAGLYAQLMTSGGGYLGYNSTHQGVLQQCRNEITAYQSALQSYNSCLSEQSNSGSNSSSSSNNFDSEMQKYCVELYGVNSSYNGKCECNSGFMKDSANNFQCTKEDTVLNNYCKAEFGMFSITLSTDKSKCTCQEGYSFDKNKQCIPMVNWCIENYGQHVHSQGNQCLCDAGYSYDTTSNKCMAQENVVIKETQVIIPKPVNKPVTASPKNTPKEIVKQPEINEGIAKYEYTDPAPQIYISTEAKPTPKQSIFKRIINWFVNLFN